MSKAVLLDSGPLGMIVHPRAAAAIVTWVNDLLAAAHRLLIPEIADYEVRRELLRANLQPSVARLDMLKRILEYLPLTTDTMLQAAAFCVCAGRTPGHAACTWHAALSSPLVHNTRGVLWTSRRARLLSAGPTAPDRGVGHRFCQLMVMRPRSMHMACCPQFST